MKSSGAGGWEAEVEAAIRVLEAVASDPDGLVRLSPELRRRLLEAAGQASRPDPDTKRRRARAFRRRDRRLDREHDHVVLSAAALRREKALSSFLPRAIHGRLGLTAPRLEGPPAEPPSTDAPSNPGSEPRLRTPRACYVCKARFDRVHFFYHSMCEGCAALNYDKRSQSARLDGRVALVTGGRIKIGYHTALKLLRAGARVLVTTRFPVDAARRFAEEPDYDSFRTRLTLHGLDLRHVPTVELFASHLADTLDRLDVLVNNAAQTVRRPPAFYEHLLVEERRPVNELPAPLRGMLRAHQDFDARATAEALTAPHEPFGGMPRPAELATTPWAGEPSADPHAFPRGLYDGERQQIDLRKDNSWRMSLTDVPTPELLEVHLVNAVAPFILVSRLEPLLTRDRTDEKHVINVSAMEASFDRKKKTSKHPHTNMAKAALNMMTRTSAVELAQRGIFMNSVDTGWVTDEDPLHLSVRKERVHDFHPPLDAIDGAARVLDPLFTGLKTGEHAYGLFFKDYLPAPW